MPTIVPLRKLPQNLLIEYLSLRGMPPDVIKWKYFDNNFHETQEKGFAILYHEKIAGFIGLLPVMLQNGTVIRHDRWACDWSIDTTLLHGKGLLGIQLMRFALEQTGSLIGYGGSEISRKIMPKLAVSRDGDAGLIFRKHLRLGSYIAALQRRKLLPENQITKTIGKIRITSLQQFPGKVSILKGLPEDLKQFPPTVRDDVWQPVYNRESLEWQLLNCPEIDVWTSHTSNAEAMVLLWRSKNNCNNWKAALYSSSVERLNHINACLYQAMKFIIQEGGESVSVIVSRLDKHFISVLNNAGFLKVNFTNPIHFLESNISGNIPSTAAGLSYLDADDQHRF